MKDRDISLDIIRIFACCLVVLMHSPLPSSNANGPFLSGLSYVTAPCIGLFFMVSGALLIPVKMEYFTFIRKRLSKVVIPTLAWTALYLLLRVYFSESELNIVRAATSVPFSAQGEGVLWFMYTLIGLYLLAPILSCWLREASDNELRFVLLLWGVTICYPLLGYVADVNTSTTGILYYFTGYAGYFLLGYALKNRRVKIPLPVSLAVSIMGVAVIVAFKAFGVEYDFYTLFWYESVFVVALCCVYWSALSWIGNRVKFGKALHPIFLLSNLAFGVYLIHILIMRYWLWKTEMINQIHSYVLQTIIVAALTLTLSFTACLFLAKTPVAVWIIGYKDKKK